MRPIALDAARVRSEIESLIAAHPELAEDEILRADTIEGSTDAHAVLATILDAMREADALEDAVAARIAALSERRKRIAARSDVLRDLALRLLHAAGRRKLELAEATLSIRAVAPRVEIDDPALIPPALTRTKTEPDKTAIRAALAAGEAVPGAHLSNGGETLAVRIT